MKKKSFADFTSVDIRNFWCLKYKEKYDEEYPTHTYLGNELHEIKTLVEDFGSFPVYTRWN